MKQAEGSPGPRSMPPPWCRRCTDPHCICTSAEAALLPSERGVDASPASLQPVGPSEAAMLPTRGQPHGNGSVSRSRSCKQLSKFNVTVSHYKLKPKSRSRRNAVYGGSDTT